MAFEDMAIEKQMDFLLAKRAQDRCYFKVVEAMIECGGPETGKVVETIEDLGIMQIPKESWAEYEYAEKLNPPAAVNPSFCVGHYMLGRWFLFWDLSQHPLPPDVIATRTAVTAHLRDIYLKKLERVESELLVVERLAVTRAARAAIEARFNEPIVVAGEVARLIGLAVDDNDNYVIVRMRKGDVEGCWQEAWISYAGGYTFPSDADGNLQRLENELVRDGCIREETFKYVDERKERVK